jgi:hypothetical protein
MPGWAVRVAAISCGAAFGHVGGDDGDAELVRQLARRDGQRLDVAAVAVDDEEPPKPSARRLRTMQRSTAWKVA